MVPRNLSSKRPTSLLPPSVLACSIVLAGCVSTGRGSLDPTPGRSVDVWIAVLKFDPSNLTIERGTRVTWTNLDGVEHTVTAMNETQWGTIGIGPFRPAWLKQGESWSHTFREAGTYRYYCTPHTAYNETTGEYSGQVGQVVVTDQSGEQARPTEGNEGPSLVEKDRWMGGPQGAPSRR